MPIEQQAGRARMGVSPERRRMMSMRRLTALLVVLVLVVPVSVFAAGKDSQKDRIKIVTERPHRVLRWVGEDENGAWLGVHMQELNAGLREAMKLGDVEGVLVADVEEGSPAEKAGIKAGDIILEVDNKETPSPGKLFKTIRKHDPGDEVDVIIWRDGKKKTVKAKLTESDHLESWVMAPDALKDVFLMKHLRGAFLGVSTMDLETDDLAEYFGVKAGDGALVMQVVEESAAEEAGIKAGDVITSVGDEKVTGPSKLVEAIAEYEPGDNVDVSLIRKGKKMKIREVAAPVKKKEQEVSSPEQETPEKAEPVTAEEPKTTAQSEDKTGESAAGPKSVENA